MTAAESRARRRLKLALVTETYPPEINGVANTMQHLVDGLSERGHQLQLVRPRQVSDRYSQTHGDTQTQPTLLVPGLPIPGYPSLRFGFPAYLRLLGHWRKQHPELVYIATQGPLGQAALRAAHRLGIPAVTGFHTQFQRYTEHYGLGLLNRPIMGLLRHFHNRSEATLVPTRRLARQLNEAGFERVRVFGRGVDTRRFHPHKRDERLRRRWGCDPSSIVLLSVGRIAAEKNIDLALTAFNQARQRDSRVRCILVGDGPELERLRRAHPEFLFLGAKVGEELARCYASSDCFVFPSLTETFGNVVLEAMASGLPTLAFDDGAAHEHLLDGVNGLIVPNEDSDAFIQRLLAVLGGKAKLTQMGAQARQTAETLSWASAIDNLEQTLVGVIRCHQDAGGRHEGLAATAE